MENLKTQSIRMHDNDYQLKEKDHGDLVVYDISHGDNYLMTIAKDGSILFMNFEAPAEEREIFKLSFLNEVIGAIQDKA